ncbi:ethanolamine utilization protein EutP [Sporanaerobium hydrogeniformans]|uniref:Ethanolamine utilization protein EutP n=1 Tax=Sporanaerobium hydrogeniformans TaxID=3072179 RepID=A0AC61DC33_9FIRM|nr:EutP/PduV family microcompartment system protein [Sporanaerobium hydrogeniformans]PHV70283.1 ethanolamine utilization protein EutP [Sporanaerobium hydrogeniformans]
MGRVIFMGRTGCGKTTLCQKLDELELLYKKTQSVEIYNHAIDTPGEYLENRHYYSALIMTAVDAELIALIGDPTAEENFIPPAFACSFAKEMIGIITKINLVKEEAQIKRIEESLKMAGVSQIFKVDTVDDVGIQDLFNYIKSFLKDKN